MFGCSCEARRTEEGEIKKPDSDTLMFKRTLKSQLLSRGCRVQSRAQTVAADTCSNKEDALEGLRLNKNALYWRDAASVILAAVAMAASLSDRGRCECVSVCFSPPAHSAYSHREITLKCNHLGPQRASLLTSSASACIIINLEMLFKHNSH